MQPRVRAPPGREDISGIRKINIYTGCGRNSELTTNKNNILLKVAPGKF
jgi:hypothetical protein